MPLTFGDQFVKLQSRADGGFCAQCNTPSVVPVTVQGVERLGGAKAIFGRTEVGYLDEAEPVGDGAFRLQVRGRCPPPAQEVQFLVGAAGPGWPAFVLDDLPGSGDAGPLFGAPAPNAPLPPAGAGNIENGVGFFGGATIKSVAIPVFE